MSNRVTLIGDLLVVAEAQTGIPAEHLLRSTSLDSDPDLLALLASFEEMEPAPSPAEEAAMLGAWIVRNRPLPEENSQIAYRFMRLMLDRSGLPWAKSEEDVFVVPPIFEALEAGAINELEFVDWVVLRVATA